jgi:DNA-binding CsgD family transcriptional regulator
VFRLVGDGPAVAAYARIVASSTAYARSRDRVVRICAAARDARDVRLELLDEIRRVVGFDAYAWLLTDPETTVGSAPLADVPCLPELPRAIGLKYLTKVNRWTTLNDPAPVALLGEATGGEPARSLLWRDLLAGYGIGDIASSAFKDRFGCWGFLDLWRSGATARFSPADTTFLTSIARPITTALRHCQANTFVIRPSRPLRLEPAVLLLSKDLDVVGQTSPTHEYLRVLVPPEHDRPPIPAGAYNVGAQLLAVEAGVDANPPCARVHLSGGLWLTLRAARIGDTEPAAERGIAVTIEETSPAERVALFARAFALSARESELLSHLAAGNDTRRVADRMFLSEHTVQDHLKSIFAKTAANNRRILLARALGT